MNIDEAMRQLQQVVELIKAAKAQAISHGVLSRSDINFLSNIIGRCENKVEKLKALAAMQQKGVQ